MQSELVVPLLHKSRPIGALNILSRNRNQFTVRDVAIVRQFAAHVAVALVNARLFERSRRDAEAFETLAEIGREVASVLDLDELFARIAQLAKRVIDYRTFGILLLNEDRRARDEARRAVRREGRRCRACRSAKGSSATRRCTARRCSCPTSRRIRATSTLVPDVRSELAIPMLLKDRCIGVVDLESPELDAFSKRDVEILTLLASQAAVAIENARLYEEVRANEERLEKEVRFAQRVQAALLPAGPPKRLKGVELAAAVRLGARARRRLPRLSRARVEHAGRRRRRRVGQGRAGGALQRVRRGARCAAERSGDAILPERSSPAGVLSSVNTILHQRQLEEYYCTLCYTIFDLKRRSVTLANSGLPYPIRCSRRLCAQIELPGVPLGSFPGSTYDEVTYALHTGDLFVFCTDGVFEAMNATGQEFTRRAARWRSFAGHASCRRRKLVEAIFDAVAEWRGDTPPNDDMTAVAVRITT